MSKIKELQPSKIKMSKPKVYLILTLAAILMSITTYYFIVAAQLYTPGLGGIAYGLSYTIVDIVGFNPDKIPFWNTMIYWVIYIIANIPIIYLTTRWFGRRFIVLSLYFFIINFLTTMLITNVLPGFSEMLFLQPGSDYLNDEGIVNIIKITLSLIAGLMYGTANGLAFKVGACTMGLDPVAKHLSREKDMNIAPILFAITIISTTIWTFVRYWTSPMAGAQAGEGFVRSTILSGSYIGSWIFVSIYSLVTGAIFSSKKVQLFVTSKKTDEISNYFNEVGYHRGHTIFEVEGGYTHEKRRSIQMIINGEEMYDTVEKIAAIDPVSFITVTELSRIYDIRDWRTMTDEDRTKAAENLKKQDKRSRERKEKRS